MQLNTHLNEWVQHIFKLQSAVQNRRNQDEARIFVVFD
jgi:hypothetical protein